MIILRIWRLIPHGCQYLYHSALATYMALIFDANSFSLAPLPTLLSCRLSLKFLFNFIQLLFRGVSHVVHFLSLSYVFIITQDFLFVNSFFLRFLKFPKTFDRTLWHQPLVLYFFLYLMYLLQQMFFKLSRGFEKFFQNLFRYRVSAEKRTSVRTFISSPLTIIIISKIFLFVKYKFWEDLCAKCR